MGAQPDSENGSENEVNEATKMQSVWNGADLFVTDGGEPPVVSGISQISCRRCWTAVVPEFMDLSRALFHDSGVMAAVEMPRELKGMDRKRNGEALL